jgi:hypothetical protein
MENWGQDLMEINKQLPLEKFRVKSRHLKTTDSLRHSGASYSDHP